GVTAAPKPVARWARMSISGYPHRDWLPEQIDEQDDRERARRKGERGELVPAQAPCRDARDHRDRDHRAGKPHTLDQQAECDDGGENEKLWPERNTLDRLPRDDEGARYQECAGADQGDAHQQREEPRSHPRQGADGEAAAEPEPGAAEGNEQD